MRQAVISRLPQNVRTFLTTPFLLPSLFVLNAPACGEADRRSLACDSIGRFTSAWFSHQPPPLLVSVAGRKSHYLPARRRSAGAARILYRHGLPLGRYCPVSSRMGTIAQCKQVRICCLYIRFSKCKRGFPFPHLYTVKNRPFNNPPNQENFLIFSKS